MMTALSTFISVDMTHRARYSLLDTAHIDCSQAAFSSRSNHTSSTTPLQRTLHHFQLVAKRIYKTMCGRSDLQKQDDPEDLDWCRFELYPGSHYEFREIRPYPVEKIPECAKAAE